MSNGQPNQQQANQAAQHFGLHQNHQNVQTQQQATNQADQQATADANKTWFMKPFEPLLKMLDEAEAETKYNDKLPAEVKSLKQGLSMRSAPGFQAANYQAYSHPQLHQMVTQGVDPATVGEAGDTWLQMGDDLSGFQGDFAQALASSETTWTGTNADGARRSVAELGNSGGTIGQAAQLAGVATHQQSQALATAKNSMPPPPAHPFNAQAAQQQLQTITDPTALATQAAADHAAAAQQQQAQQQAAHVVREYDTTVAQSSANMPAFAPAPKVVKQAPGQTSPTGPSSPSGPGLPSNGTFAPHANSNPGSTGSTGSTSGTRSSSGGGFPGTPPPSMPSSGPSGTVPGQTSTADYTGPGTSPGSSPGSGPYGGGNSYSGTPGGNPADALGGGMIGPMGGGGGLGGLGGDMPRTGGGFGPGAGGMGSGAGGSGSTGGAGGAGGSSGAGARSGAGAGAAAAEEAAVQRGAASAQGASGSSGMTPGARGGQKGGQDAEHKRASYLVEPDPNDIFGADEQTAPPVIG